MGFGMAGGMGKIPYSTASFLYTLGQTVGNL